MRLAGRCLILLRRRSRHMTTPIKSNLRTTINSDANGARSSCTNTAQQTPQHVPMPAWMTFLLAAACGLIVANVYFAQPLISLIAADVGLNKSAASLIVTLTQGGYCAGLLLLVPLGDLIENRRLIVTAICGVILA